MRKSILIIATYVCTLFVASCAQSQDCVDGINKLPMYGGVKKCKEYLEDDKIFLAESDKNFKNRKDAAKHMITRGWEYLYSGKPDTAMMRFNQAWLLDSLNADIYWGYGNLLGMQGKFKESLPFFGKSMKLNPKNAKVLHDASVSYGNTFYQTKDVKYLNSSIQFLKTAISIEPRNAQFYAQLTAAYSYFNQKDSAKKYLKITDKLDFKVINPEVRKMLTGK